MNISSAIGRLRDRGFVGYGTAKAALSHMTAPHGGRPRTEGPGERHRRRLGRHERARGRARQSRDPRRDGAPHAAQAPRRARRTSPTARCTSRRPPRASSPARSSRSTAASKKPTSSSASPTSEPADSTVRQVDVSHRVGCDADEPRAAIRPSRPFIPKGACASYPSSRSRTSSGRAKPSGPATTGRPHDRLDAIGPYTWGKSPANASADGSQRSGLVSSFGSMHEQHADRGRRGRTSRRRG